MEPQIRWLPPVPALADNPNIEDCKWHTFRIIWDANTQILSAEIDNVPRVQGHILIWSGKFSAVIRRFTGDLPPPQADKAIFRNSVPR